MRYNRMLIRLVSLTLLFGIFFEHFALIDVHASLGEINNKEEINLVLSNSLRSKDTGVSIFILGIGVKKVNDFEYSVLPNTKVTISAINETRKFLNWDVSGISIDMPESSYTSFMMPNNIVTIDANWDEDVPSDIGTAMINAYTLDDFNDFYALQEIINKGSTINSVEIPVYNDYFRAFGLSINLTSDFPLQRDKLIKGYFKVTNNVSLTQPNLSELPVKLFKGIGNSLQNSFQGVIDGDNKHIVLNINTTSQYAGLFGYVKQNSLNKPTVLRNLSIMGSIASTATSNSYVGGIAGWVDPNILIYNCESGISCYAKTGNYILCVGGLVGYCLSSIGDKSNNRYKSYLMPISSESGSYSYTGGCFGYVKDAFVLDATSYFENSKMTSVVSRAAASLYSASGGVIGYFENSQSDLVCIKNCFTKSSNFFTINATMHGSSKNSYACSGGVVGVIKNSSALGKIEVSNNCVDTDEDNNDNDVSSDEKSFATIYARDYSKDSISSIEAGGIYGRIDATNISNITLLEPFATLNPNNSDDAFNGNINIVSEINGKSDPFVGGVCAENLFLKSNGFSCDLTNVTIQANIKNTSTSSINGYTGGLVGKVQDNLNLENITLYGDNVLIEESCDSGTNGKTGPLNCGGIVGYKKGGKLSNGRVLFTNSKIMLNQNSFLYVTGNVSLGGIIGFSSSNTINDCIVAGPILDNNAGYSGSTAEISSIINTKYAVHGAADNYTGGIVGYATGGSIYNCKYIGDEKSHKDIVKMVSNQGANSPSVGGIGGFVVSSKTYNCNVINANIYGDAYNPSKQTTDTDVIVGGIIGLINGSANPAIENSTISNSTITANGRDYTLTYSGGILGSHFSVASATIVKGCISENNNIKANAQKKWAACGGILGYNYDSTVKIENSMSIGDTLFSTSAGTEADQDPDSIGGGIVGKAIGTSCSILRCFSNAQFILTHVDNSRIYIGGLIGWKAGTTGTYTDSFYHMQNTGTNIAIGNNSYDAQKNIINKSCLDFSDVTLDQNNPKKALFQTGLNTTNSRIIVTKPYSHDVVYLTANEVINGVTCKDQYKIEKRPNINEVSTTEVYAIITQYQPGSTTVMGTEGRYFGNINTIVISGTIPQVNSIILHRDSEDGEIIQEENSKVFLKVDLESKEPALYYAITDIPIITEEGIKEYRVNWNFYKVDISGPDYVFTHTTASYLTDSGANIEIIRNHIEIKANIPIDKPRVLAFEAVDPLSGQIKSERVIVTIEPVYVEKIKIDSYLTPEGINAKRGSINDINTPLGSSENPFIIINGSNLKLTPKVYGAGSKNIGLNDEIYVQPTVYSYLFGAAEYVSGADGGISVFADGTVFTSAAALDPLNPSVYRVKAFSVGIKEDGIVAETDYIYIKLAYPSAVIQLTSGSINTKDGKIALAGGSITGLNTCFLNLGTDYIFIAAPQTGYGGVPEVYYSIGANEYEKIPTGEQNEKAYGEIFQDQTQNMYQFIIKANDGYNGSLTIAVKYNLVVPVLFFPQDEKSHPLVLNLPPNLNLGSVPTISREGYTFEGWYGVDYADTDAAYGKIVNENTIVNGGSIYYARWKYKVTIENTPCIFYSGTIPENDIKDYTFTIIKKSQYVGAPVCNIYIGDQINPIEVPKDYDNITLTPIEHYADIDGINKLAASLNITKNVDGDTLYTYTFYSDYINKYIDSKNDEKDGILVSLSYINSDVISKAGEKSDMPPIILQDTIFTVSYISNHWKDTINTDSRYSTFAFRDENKDKNKDLKLRLKKSDGSIQSLPKDTSIKMHYRIKEEKDNTIKRSVYKYILKEDADSFLTSSFAAIGEISLFALKTFSEFIKSNVFVVEEYYFEISVPFQSNFIDIQDDLTFEIGFVDGDDVISETLKIVKESVFNKRNVGMSLSALPIVIDKNKDNEFTIDADFSNVLDQYEGVDNRVKSFGISISFIDSNGKNVWLTNDSKIEVSSSVKEHKINTLIFPIEKYHFIANKGFQTIKFHIPSLKNEPIPNGNEPILLQKNGMYTMQIQLTAASFDYLYGNGYILDTITIPVEIVD